MNPDERRRPLAASGWTLPRVLAAAAGLLVVAVWISSGSLIMALLVLVLVAGTIGLGVVVFSWATRGPRPAGDGLPDARPTNDLDHVPGPADRVRRAVRGLLARPWVRGDALVRAATARLASEDALVFTPRGQQVAAPHLWIEWNTSDLSEVADRWPLDVLARELADGYLDQTRQRGVRRLADRTWVYLLAGPDVPVGRVVVTAAFSRPQQTALASACAPEAGSLDGWSPEAAPAPPPRPAIAQAPAAPAPAPAPRRMPPPRPAEPETGLVTTGRLRPAGSRPARETASAMWRRVVPVLRTMRVPQAAGPPRPPHRAAPPATVGVLVAETPHAADVVLAGAVGTTVVLGRDPHADVVVDHPGVSWRHLTITRRDATSWVVTDTGSTNGTLVHDRPATGPTPVRTGEVIGLGQDGPQYRLALRSVPSAGPSGGDPNGSRTRVEVA